MSFKDELEKLCGLHGVEGAMFVIVSNPDKGKEVGNLMVSVESTLDSTDTAGGIILIACRKVVEEAIPGIFGNAIKVERNG